MKVDRLAWKTSFPQKTPKNSFFGGKESGLPDFGRSFMPIGTMSTFRLPLKTAQSSNWEGRWHRNWGHSRPPKFFAREISEKRNFFVNRSLPENFQRENFSGQVPTESLRTQDSENVYERWVQQMFDPVLVGRSWVSATKWGPLAKLCGVKKDRYGHNFQNIASKTKKRWVIVK